MRGAAIAREAQAWAGTPYMAQQAVKGAGCDCVGLVRGVGEALGVLAVDPLLAEPFRAYPMRPRKRTIVKALNTFLVRRPAAAAPAPGDVVLFRLHRLAQPSHLGIRIDGRTIAHANESAGRVVVTEIPPELALAGAWRYPGATDD